MSKYISYLFLFILLFIFSCNNNKNQTICKITLINGKVYQLDENRNIISEVKEGDVLKTTSLIKTEGNSYADVEFSDKTTVRIQENSIIKIDKFYIGFVSEKTKVYIELGEVFAKLDKMFSGQTVEFETNTIVLKVDQAEFIVSVSEDKITKVAIKEGKINYSTKLDSTELEAIKKKDPKIAKKIEEIIYKNNTLKANQKLETSYDDYLEYNRQISNVINIINKELENNKNDNKTRNKILKKYVENIDHITKESKNIKIEKMNENEWAELLDSVEKGKQALKPAYIWVIKKISKNPGLYFQERNTAITSDLNNIYVSSNSHNAVFSLNSLTGNINWKFTDPDLNNIYSMAVPFGNSIVIGTPEKFFIINVNGKKIFDNSISNGTTYWASPVKINSILYLPTSSGIYEFYGDSLSKMNEIKNISGQIYLSGNSNYLSFIDINDAKVKVYDINEKKIIFISNKIINRVFMAPIFYEMYILIADSKGLLYMYDLAHKNPVPSILPIESGVITNLIIKNDFLYLLANNGNFYKVKLPEFNKTEKIMKVELKKDINKFLTKKLLLANDDIIYCTDSGKLFVYNTETGNADLIKVPNGNEQIPLIASPVMIGNVVFFLDQKSNIYKRFKDVE